MWFSSKPFIKKKCKGGGEYYPTSREAVGSNQPLYLRPTWKALNQINPGSIRNGIYSITSWRTINWSIPKRIKRSLPISTSWTDRFTYYRIPKRLNWTNLIPDIIIYSISWRSGIPSNCWTGILITRISSNGISWSSSQKDSQQHSKEQHYD